MAAGNYGTARLDRGGTGIDLVELALPFFIVLNFIYSSFYNALPEEYLTPIAALTFAGQAGLAVVSLLSRPGWWRWRLFFVIMVLPFVWLAAYLILRQTIDFPQMLRYLGGFYMGVLVFGHYDRFPTRLVAWGAVLSVVWIMLWSMTQPLYLHSNEAEFEEPVPGWWAAVVGNGRLAPFHGGYENPHSSGYMALALMLVVHQSWLAGAIPAQVMGASVFFSMVYILGCFSTQVLFAAVVYFGCYGLFTRRISRPMKLVVALAGMIIMGIILTENEERKAAVRVDTDIKWEELGSGRLGTWAERAFMISIRDGPRLWLGTGIGSDFMPSIMWRLKDAPSHNVFLTMMIESGIIGSIAYWAALIMMMRALGRLGICLFSVVFVTAMIGNGITLRPMPFLMFFIAVAMGMQAVERDRKLEELEVQRRRMAARLADRDRY
ncbi:MAG: hypothetical protein VYB54_12040 [Pseudomonadota bacterium]|nr:hypothetical protein [Pseudomonadota bacterium]